MQLGKVLGPGLLIAAAAIGASHLVQSTQAGARYGFSLLWLVLLANVLKYPFFEAGQRYTAATGQTLLAGYLGMGRWYLVVYVSVCMVTMLTSIAGVSVVTAGLCGHLLGAGLELGWTTAGVTLLCMLVLMVGRYRWLDGLSKAIVGLLGLTTVVAFGAAVWHGPVAGADFVSPDPWQLANVAFLVSLQGWMPAPIELSAWSGLWMKERESQTGHRASLRETLVDFKLGYIGTTVLAGVFLGLGALVMHGSQEAIEERAVPFAGQLVRLFTSTLGDGVGPVVMVAALLTMFSTTLTCLDGYPRSVATACTLLRPGLGRWWTVLYFGFGLLSTAMAIVTATFFAANLSLLIQILTAFAFLTAPVFAGFNHRLIRRPEVPAEFRQGRLLTVLSRAGLFYLVGFSLVYLGMLGGLVG